MVVVVVSTILLLIPTVDIGLLDDCTRRSDVLPAPERSGSILNEFNVSRDALFRTSHLQGRGSFLLAG